MRYEDPDNVILKAVLPPEEDYDFHVESQTLEELSNLEMSEQLAVESLIAKERILGKYGVAPGDLIEHGHRMARRNNFVSCRKLWNRAINIYIHNNKSITGCIRGCAVLFSGMIEHNMSPESEWMINILSLCVEELKRNYTKLKLNPQVDVETADIKFCVVIIMRTALFLAYALIVDAKVSNDIQFKAKKLIYQLIKLKPTSTVQSEGMGYTLMHMACDANTQLNELFDKYRMTYPNYTLVSLLLECGIDVNVRDSHNNTALHILVKRCRDNNASQIDNDRQICQLLLSKGAHIDYANDQGEIPSDYGELLDVLSPELANRSLVCLAARVIKLNNIAYKNNVPVTLEDMISKH